MFTGIIQDIGEIQSIDKAGDWKVTIRPRALSTTELSIGGSIACSGICLTVVEKSYREFKVQLSMETLSRTSAIQWQIGTPLNLERALRLGEELGGHLVTGHVDGLAYLTEKRPNGDSLYCRFEPPSDYMRFISMKGSVVLDGISLTINEIRGREFAVNIIPHTQKVTTISSLPIGGSVNLEVDMIARYIERLMINREENLSHTDNSAVREKILKEKTL